MLENKLINKKIIFFSVQTFNLEKEIITKLEEFGAKVDYYDERPSNSNYTKGIIRLKRELYQHKIPDFFLKKFKELNPDCIFIFYTWDSFINNNHPTTILKYFDRKFTFDPEDAEKFNINFRPLFYLDYFREVKKNEYNKKSFDLLFLGTAHSDRYRIGNSIINWCKQNNLNTYAYYFMHGRIVYFYKKLFDKTFKEFEYKKLKFKSLTLLEIVNLYIESNVILDINHPGQKGLTMRTFEAIGANKKIITTNKEIKRYSFFNPNNILVIERNEETKISKDFFENQYESISLDLYNKLSIEGWLNCLFFCNESNIWIKELK
jgi:hypothetical protein